ncbi:MAG: DNA repair protein RadC [Nitrospirales bacterium]|nr:DNA repair protein RadC [Nitrospirales bacterium]
MNYRIPIIKLSVVRDGSLATQERIERKISHSGHAARICREMLQGEDREHFIALHLDSKNKVVSVETIAIGSLATCTIHPREVFKAAIMRNSGRLIVCHNHPSGDPTPSEEDHALTNRLKQAGELLGVPILDHIIVGDEDQYYSFADKGTL